MPVDLGTPIIEVALGLAFVYFLFSIVISSAVEGIAKVFQVRENNLEKGVKLVLGDEELADKVIAHPLFKSDVTGKRRKRPAYVAPRSFALALTRVLRREGRHAGAQTSVDEIKLGIEGTERRAREQLDGLLDEVEPKYGKGKVAAFRTAVEHWYEDGMDRVSGWYRGWAQIMTCVLALAVAVGLNVDSIRIAERLGENTSLRAAAVAGAESAVSEGEQASEGGAEAEKGGGAAESEKTEAEAKGKSEAVARGAQTAISEISGLHLPILWGEDNDNVTLNTAFGWLITFLALSLGAPFWFSALGKISHLKTTGKEPAPTK